MRPLHIAAVLITASFSLHCAADTTFEKLSYRITFPSEWADSSKPGMHDYTGPNGERVLGWDYAIARPLSESEVKAALLKFAEARVQSARAEDGDAVKFEEPVISVTAKNASMQIQGTLSGDKRISTYVIRSSRGFIQFTYLGSSADGEEFRSNATRIFKTIQLTEHPLNADPNYAQVLFSGIYRSSFSKPVPREPTFRELGHMWTGPRPVIETDRIPARTGVEFGILFIPRGEQLIGAGELQIVIEFPENGLSDPKSKSPVPQLSGPLNCIRYTPCFAGFIFEQPWELVSGNWKISVLLRGNKLFEKTYIVEKPRDAL